MSVLMFAVLPALSSLACDSLSVIVPDVPLLAGKEDNVLFVLKTGSGNEEDFVLQFAEDTDMSEIKSLAVYAAGNGSVPLLKVSDLSGKSLRLETGNFGNEGEYQVTIGMADSVLLTKPLRFSIDGDWHIRRKAVVVRDFGDDGAAAYRIPGLVTTAEGTLVAVYDIRYGSSADLQGDIKVGVSRSEDGGRTWLPMSVAMDFEGYLGLPREQNGVGDPCILYDRFCDRLWLAALWCHGMPGKRAWTASGRGVLPEETGQLVLSWSDDEGLTWAEPVNITAMVKDPSWYLLLQGPGRGIAMEDGTLVFPAQFIDSTRTPNATVIFSKDAGRSWQMGNPARSSTTESQVVEYPEGMLMLNMRDDRGGSRAVSVSGDMGRNWTAHPSSRSALREPVCMASLIAVKAGDNVTGKDLLIFSNPDSSQERKDITVKISLDGGLTWPSEHQVLLDSGRGWGYSCLTMVDQATVGILYESSVANLVFQAIPLEDFFQ